MTTAMLKIGTKHWKTACKLAEAENARLRAALYYIANADVVYWTDGEGLKKVAQRALEQSADKAEG